MAGRLWPNNAETRPEKAFDPRPGDRGAWARRSKNEKSGGYAFLSSFA